MSPDPSVLIPKYVAFMIAFPSRWVGGVARAMRGIVKRRRRPPAVGKSDRSGAFQAPSGVVAVPL